MQGGFIALLGGASATALLVGATVAAPDTPDSSPTTAMSAPILVAAGASTANSARYSLGTESFTAGKLYVAFVLLSETGGSADHHPGVEGAGTTWSQIDSGQAASGGLGLTAYSFAPTTDATDVALSTAQLSTGHEGIWYSIVEVSGDFDSANPATQYSAGVAGRGRSYTRTLPGSPWSDSLVLGAFAHAANEGSTPDSGWTEVAGSDLGHGAPARAAHLIFDETSAAATGGSSWATSSKRRGILIEIRSTTGQAPPGVTLAGAGDLCRTASSCRDTSNRVADANPEVVVTMGDLAYASGLLSEFTKKYGGGTNPPSGWGRPSLKDITLPNYGNHDCLNVPLSTGATKHGCDGAVAYFGADSTLGTDIPGTPGSYYNVVGDWLIVNLNSAGDNGSGEATASEISSQQTALHDLLVADTHTCEIVIWHHPRFSSGSHGNNPFVDPWFDTAYDDGVDVILNGHDHDYERFDPQDGEGNAVGDGVRELVVGTGGAEFGQMRTPEANSAVRIVDRGILTMNLNDDATYTWAFLDDITAAVDDSGTGTCHP